MGITTDGGATYSLLNACLPLADGTGLLRHHEFDLGPYAGLTVQVIFVYDTRDAVTGHTFAVDNVLITARPDGCRHLPAQLDADQDFHSTSLCGGDDCDDADPSVWGVPIEVTNLLVTQPGPADLSWDGQGFLSGPSTEYDLASGSLTQAPRLDYAAGVCLQSSQATSHADARSDPSPGSGFWYLVRGRNSCGSGTYGPAAADPGITACP